jgi:uncharacterized protein YgiM (DUF1202 family)
VGRIIATLGGVLVLAIFAGSLTEATLAFGRSGISDDVLLRPTHVAPSSSKSPTPSPSPSATPTPSPTPAPTPTERTATTNGFVHLRAGNSTTSAIIIDLQQGTTVTLLPYSDVSWQQVQYNGQTGYIFKSYLNY